MNDPSSQPPILLTSDELARALGNRSKTGGQTMRDWMREGRIPAAIREGKFVRFDLEAVKAALAKRAAPGGWRHRAQASKKPQQ